MKSTNKPTYTGTSRPSGHYNKPKLEVMENNLSHFNKGKRKNILSVEHYVDGGDRWMMKKDGELILGYMTLDECYASVAAIINYTTVK